MQEKECFGCGGWGHIVRSCRIKEQREVATLQSSNKFEVLRSRVMDVGVLSRREVKKDRRMTLRKERSKKGGK